MAARSSWAVGEPDGSLSPPVINFVLSIAIVSKIFPSTSNDGENLLVRAILAGLECASVVNILCSKFEHSNTFGLVASASSNAIWAKDEQTAGAGRQTGAGRAVVGAGEAVLCWDVKKGELLGRWRDSACRAPVTVVAQSQTDEDIFAVG